MEIWLTSFFFIAAHLHSEAHNELLNQILPVIESSGGIESNPLNWIEIRDKSDENLSGNFLIHYWSKKAPNI